MSVQEDPVLSEAMRENDTYLIRRIERFFKKRTKGRRDPGDSMKESLSLIQLLEKEISRQYHARLSEIIPSIVTSNSDDIEIYRIARAFVSEMQWVGFDPRYILHTTDIAFGAPNRSRVLASGQEGPVSPEASEIGQGQLLAFHRYFAVRERAWTIWFFGSRIFSSYRQSLQCIGIQAFALLPSRRSGLEGTRAVESTLGSGKPSLPRDMIRSRLTTDRIASARVIARILEAIDKHPDIALHTPVLLCARNITAVDPYRARATAESRLDRFCSLCSFYGDKNRFEWNATAIVEESCPDGICDLNRRSADAPDYDRYILRRKPGSALTERVGSTQSLIESNRLDRVSRTTLTSVIASHHATTEVKKPEARLASLWSSIEAFVPPRPESASKANYYADFFANVLSSYYPETVIRYVARRAMQVPGVLEFVRKWQAELPAKSVDDALRSEVETALMAVLVCEDQGEARSVIVRALEARGQYLRSLQARMCYRNFRNSLMVGHAMSRHQRKVRWNVARIYAARNVIVHRLGTVHDVNTLAEIARSYLITLVEMTVDTLIQRKDLTTIEEAVHLLNQRSGERIKVLSKHDCSCTIKTFPVIIMMSVSDWEGQRASVESCERAELAGSALDAAREYEFPL
jgi:hypothetical protein